MKSLIMTVDPLLNPQKATEVQLNEELNWIQAAKNDLQAFRPLYEKYYEPVYLFIHRRCNHSDDCLDITSRVFEKAMLSISKYKYMGYAFSTWLYRIAQNELYDYFKKQNKAQKLWVHDDGLAEISKDIAYDTTADEQLELVIDALKTISDSDRNTIVMRYFEKRSYEELAAIEEIKVEHLRVKIHRIIQRIKKEIERKHSL